MTICRGNTTEDDINNTIRELGIRLKNIREAQGRSLNEISELTKIQKRYLQAIETGELSLLPKGPYVRGFIRQYCEFLSAPDLWGTYDVLTAASLSEADEETENAKQDYISSPKVFKASSHWWILVVVILSLAAAGWITWSYRGEITGISTSPISGGTAVASLDRQTSEAAASLDAVASEDQSAVGVDLSWMDGQSAPKTGVQAGTAEGKRSAVINEPVPAGKNVLHIAAASSCWVRVSSGEQILYSGTMKAGESKTYTVTNRAIRIKYGNPGGVGVTWNGSTISPLGSGTKPMTKVYRQDGTVIEE